MRDTGMKKLSIETLFKKKLLFHRHLYLKFSNPHTTLPFNNDSASIIYNLLGESEGTVTFPMIKSLTRLCEPFAVSDTCSNTRKTQLRKKSGPPCKPPRSPR